MTLQRRSCPNPWNLRIRFLTWPKGLWNGDEVGIPDCQHGPRVITQVSTRQDKTRQHKQMTTQRGEPQRDCWKPGHWFGRQRKGSRAKTRKRPLEAGRGPEMNSPPGLRGRTSHAAIPISAPFQMSDPWDCEIISLWSFAQQPGDLTETRV